MESNQIVSNVLAVLVAQIAGQVSETLSPQLEELKSRLDYVTGTDDFFQRCF